MGTGSIKKTIREKHAPQQKLCCGVIFLLFCLSGNSGGCRFLGRFGLGLRGGKALRKAVLADVLAVLYTPTVRNGTTTTAMPR